MNDRRRTSGEPTLEIARVGAPAVSLPSLSIRCAPGLSLDQPRLAPLLATNRHSDDRCQKHRKHHRDIALSQPSENSNENETERRKRSPDIDLTLVSVLSHPSPIQGELRHPSVMRIEIGQRGLEDFDDIVR